MNLTHATRTARQLWSLDAKNVTRDSLLRWILLLPVPLALAVRWIFPPAVERLVDTLGFDLGPHYVPLMGVALLLLCPSLAGMVVGFLLLDQRDDRTLTALEVTPLPLPGYLAHRLAAPVAVSFALTLGMLLLAGLAPADLALVTVAACAAAVAPLFALALAGLAANKVEGLVLVKASNVFSVAPAIAYFLPAEWQWPFGLAPTFWPAKAYWLALAGDPLYLVYVVVGIIYSIVAGKLLLRRLEMTIHGQ